MSAESGFVSLYVTHPSREEAVRLARLLVEEKLVACASVSQPVTSVYAWEGAILEDTEVVLTAKTQSHLFDRVRARVTELHPYDCPCILALPIEAGNAPYLAWMKQVTLER